MKLHLSICGSYVVIAPRGPDPEDSDLFIVNWQRCNIAAVRFFALIFRVNEADFNNERSYRLL